MTELSLRDLAIPHPTVGGSAAILASEESLPGMGLT